MRCDKSSQSVAFIIGLQITVTWDQEKELFVYATTSNGKALAGVVLTHDRMPQRGSYQYGA